MQKPYENQENHIYHRNLSSVAPIFSAKRSSSLEQGVCFLFPTAGTLSEKKSRSRSHPRAPMTPPPLPRVHPTIVRCPSSCNSWWSRHCHSLGGGPSLHSCAFTSDIPILGAKGWFWQMVPCTEISSNKSFPAVLLWHKKL